MKAFITPFRQRLRQFDPCLIVCTTLLSAVSVLLIYGLRDSPMAGGIAQFRMQLAATLTGIVAMLFISTLDYKEVVSKTWIPLIIAEIGILGITLLFGRAAGENKSWLTIGPVTLQPSEFVKLSYIITFSKHIDLVKEKINHPLYVLTLIAHSAAVISLILLSGDLGVALVYIGFSAVMLYCGGLSVFYFLGAGLAAGLAVPYVWPHLREDQQQRIIYGFTPEKDPLNRGMQPLMGRSAIMNGGLFGKGLNGGSVYKTLYACETDFAFSSLCEKFGMICGIAVLAVMCVLVVRLFMIAGKARDDCGCLLCAGIAGIIIIQTAENVGMCLARLPVVGITLPFISYGGSSVFAMYLMMGVAHSVRAGRVRYRYETAEPR
jgi:rod shape determining protein RodA